MSAASESGAASRGIEVAERQQQPRVGDEHVLGHAAVEPEAAAEGADLGLALAVVLRREAAGAAAAAAPGPVDGDRLADLQPLDPGAERLDPAGVLVAEREGQVEGHRPLRPLHQVQVGVAGAGAGDLDQDLAGAGLGNRDLAHLRRRLPGGQLVGLHGRGHPSTGQGAPRSALRNRAEQNPGQRSVAARAEDQQVDSFLARLSARVAG